MSNPTPTFAEAFKNDIAKIKAFFVKLWASIKAWFVKHKL